MKDYSENSFLKGMQSCQLQILKELDKVCRKNNIPYYLAFGTALGAVRHKGFIPWDDDIDVYMRVEDVRKLTLHQKDFPPNLFIQTRESDSEYGLLIARIRDSNTTLIEADHVERDINHGVYIDIYPLFYCPENDFKMKIVIVASLLCRLFAFNAPPAHKGPIYRFISKALLYLMPTSFKKRITDILYQYLISRPKSKYLSNIPDVSLGKRNMDNWFREPSVGDFEGEKVPLPTMIEDYLIYEFGDYMKLPPIEKREIHHEYLFADFETPYITYKGIKYCNKV